MEAVVVIGLPFSVFEASRIKQMLPPIINETPVCLNRYAVRSILINQAADYRNSLAVALKNKLVAIKFDITFRKGRGYFVDVNVQNVNTLKTTIVTSQCDKN